MSQRKFERDARRRQAGEKRARRRRAGLAAGAVGTAVLLAPSAANAASFAVDNTNDSTGAGACDPGIAGDCTLRDAVANANGAAGPDTITFETGVTGTIRLTQGHMDVNEQALTITGPGASQLTVSGDKTGDGDSADDTRLFDIYGGPVGISGLTLADGDGSTGSGVDTVGDGGAIRTFADLTLTDCVVTGNRTTAGTGGGVSGSGGSADLKFEDTEVSQNNASGRGGGIASRGSVEMIASVISGNTSASGGGGVAQIGVEPNEKYSLLAVDTTITGNNAANGGGVMIDGATTKYSVIQQSTVSGNTATGPGGGIDFVNEITGTHNVANSTIAGNQGTIGGGIHGGETNIITRAAAPQNRAEIGDQRLDVFNSTVAANTATQTGGGIGLEDDAAAGEQLGLISTIVADNVAPTNQKDLSTTGDEYVSDHSLLENVGTTPVTTDAAKPTILSQDPKLGALASNGGPTQTKLPAASSPAIDKGNNPDSLTEEQRHTARTRNLATPNATGGDGTDVGAVEISSVPVVPPTTTTTTPPPRPVTPSATPTVCGRRAISLVRADVRGKRVVLKGLVGAALYGKQVTIQTDPEGARNSAFTRTTTVTASSKTGAFTASVPKPSADDFVSIRYRARSGRAVSPSLKLPQSLTSRSVKSAKGTITVKGRVKKSVLGKRNRVKIRRLVCGRYRTVGTAKPDENGNYSVTFESTQLRGVAFYRAESKVLRKPGSKVYVIQYARAIAIRTTPQTG